MSDRPSDPPPQDTSEPIEPGTQVPAQSAMGLGLSNADVDELVQVMSVVVWRVGCRAHVDRSEVVHDAFVLALCKPVNERPPITDRKRFFAWMCTLTEYAALTNLHSSKRRFLAVTPLEDVLEAVGCPPPEMDHAGMRNSLEKALTSLDPELRALLVAHYVDGKTIQEIAEQQRRKWTTIASRRDRALKLLRAALQSMITAIILFFTTHARARGVAAAQRFARVFPHAAQGAAAMTVTAACGLTVPTSSAATAPAHEPEAAWLAPKPALAMVATPSQPPPPMEVDPVKPDAIDEPAKQCSASIMKTTKIGSYLQGMVVPFAFLIAPAMTQVACGGAEPQASPPQTPPPAAPAQEEEGGEGMDPYDMMCENQQRRGSPCPTREEFEKW